MTFVSYDFALFLPIVFTIYWTLGRNTAKWQNYILLLASGYFFLAIDAIFLLLLLIAMGFTYGIAQQIFRQSDERKMKYWLWLGLAGNVGVLLYFKYADFFIQNAQDAFTFFGVSVHFTLLHVLLPVGLSFYTFQHIGYLLDIYYEEIEPYSNLLHFGLYGMYFPKLLSGPVERAQHFIPQLQTKRLFDTTLAVDGLRQILWGFFAKVVIAENCATLVNPIFHNPSNYDRLSLCLAAFLYAIQLYADFSGYSNMAIGISKLFGIRLLDNFRTPFFSTSIADYWRGWHISLTQWMMDYVFTPLSFTLRNLQKWGTLLAIIVTFLIVGMWHGAQWNFIIYGLVHGLYFVPMVWSGSMQTGDSKPIKTKLTFSFFGKMLALFVLISFTDIIFRSATLSEATNFYQLIIEQPWMIRSSSIFFSGYTVLVLIFISLFFSMEWLTQNKSHNLAIGFMPKPIRWSLYYGLVLLIVIFGKSSETFIYVQF